MIKTGLPIDLNYSTQSVESGKKITVDFNGCVYTVHKPTVGSTGTETNGFQLLKDSNITFMNGKLNSADAMILIQNYCNLTLDGMVLDGTNLANSNSYTLSNNNGTILIKDTTIIAKSGGVAFDVCGFANYYGPSVTVDGKSVIKGVIELSSDVNKTYCLSLNLVSGTFTIITILNGGDAVTVTNSGNVTIGIPTGYEWNADHVLIKTPTA